MRNIAFIECIWTVEAEKTLLIEFDLMDFQYFQKKPQESVLLKVLVK